MDTNEYESEVNALPVNNVGAALATNSNGNKSRLKPLLQFLSYLVG